MAGFTDTGKTTELGHDPEKLAGPASLRLHVDQQQGPGPLGTTRLTSMPSQRTGRLYNIPTRKEYRTSKPQKNM
jgi:hypothetical protein